MKRIFYTKLKLVFSTIFILSSFSLFSQSTFYSQGTGNFTTTTNWDTNSDGGGSDPVDLADMQDGNDSFIIQDEHTITLDDSININNLTVGEGTSGGLIFGNDATARQLVVQGTLTTGSSATITISANNATHTFYIQGAVTNNGSIDLRNSSSQVANTILDGTFTISGNTSQFNNITFNTGTITAGVAFDIEANVIIETGATFADGDFIHTVAGDWTENGTGAMTGSGTIQMDATLVQSIKTASAFNNLTFNGGSVATISGANNENILTVNGNLLITNNTEVSTSSRHTVAGNFTVADGSEFTANDGRITFNSASAQTIDIGSNATILYIQGPDNFPSGFSTYTFETSSQCRYDGALDQTVRVLLAPSCTKKVPLFISNEPLVISKSSLILNVVLFVISTLPSIIILAVPRVQSLSSSSCILFPVKVIEPEKLHTPSSLNSCNV